MALHVFTLLYTYDMQAMTRLKKRKALTASKELKALNSMRLNEDLKDAITFYISQPHLKHDQIARLQAVLAVLSHAPLNEKLLASL